MHINLFDFLIDYLRERKVLEKSLRLQREEGSDALLKALKGILHEEKVAQRFANDRQSRRPRSGDDIGCR